LRPLFFSRSDGCLIVDSRTKRLIYSMKPVPALACPSSTRLEKLLLEPFSLRTLRLWRLAIVDDFAHLPARFLEEAEVVDEVEQMRGAQHSGDEDLLAR
jgi:hypothetical protein